MAGLIDAESIGLCEQNTGIIWLTPGLGSDGLWNDSAAVPTGAMISESSVVMITEASVIMITES